MKKVLIVEDEATLLRTLARHLRRRGAEVVEAASCEQAREALRSQPDIETVITDVVLPDGRGYEVVDEVGASAAIVVMTGESVLDHAIAALRHGAVDFLMKPFSLEALDEALGRVTGRKNFEAIAPASPSELAEWRTKFCPEILGEDQQLLKVFDVIRRVADTDCPVLITGETGTGKELVAKAIHRASERRNHEFVPVNCAAIPENLMESELFGHAKGAFTGATGNYAGRFAVADQGTLILDEIGEMALPMQAKLLRVLQEGAIRPVGETKERSIDVRVLAATHRDIEEMAARGEFREDLLYRLDVIRIELPSLRARRSDIPLLVDSFVRESVKKRGRNVEGMEPAALGALSAYRWPGNVRQLRHTVERMVLLSTGSTLTLDDVPTRIRDHVENGNGSEGTPILPEAGLDLKDAVEQFENSLIVQALERTGWNKNQAASILQMNRTTLVEKIKKKGLTDPSTDQVEVG